MTNDILALLGNLSQDRPIFHSEADFQHAIAWRIHEIIPDAQVRLEFKPFLEKRIYLDIWLQNDGTAIELKYPTRRLSLDSCGEAFALRDQGAQDITRYDFLKDIQRLEEVTSSCEKAKAGFAILLTNDPSYWKASSRVDTVDAAFRLHEGRRITGELAWLARAAPGTTKGRKNPIRLNGSYKLHWRDYSNLGEGNYRLFRYLLIEV